MKECDNPSDYGEPDQQDDRRRDGGKLEGRLLLPEQVHELVMDDLDDLVPRPDALEDVGPDGLLLDALKELAGQVEADVRLEEHPPDVPKSFADRIFRKRPTAGEGLERGAEFL